MAEKKPVENHKEEVPFSHYVDLFRALDPQETAARTGAFMPCCKAGAADPWPFCIGAGLRDTAPLRPAGRPACWSWYCRTRHCCPALPPL